MKSNSPASPSEVLASTLRPGDRIIIAEGERTITSIGSGDGAIMKLRFLGSDAPYFCGRESAQVRAVDQAGEVKS